MGYFRDDDIIGLLALGFWKWVFDRRFRADWMQEYAEASPFESLMKLGQLFVAAVLGLGMPAIILVGIGAGIAKLLRE